MDTAIIVDNRLVIATIVSRNFQCVALTLVKVLLSQPSGTVCLLMTYFIESHHIREFCDTYWAATSVNSCNLVQLSYLALDNLKKLCKSTTNWSISKGSLEILFLKDILTLCSVQVSSVQKSFTWSLFKFSYQVFLEF